MSDTTQLLINAYLAGASAALRNRGGTFLECAQAYAAEHAPAAKPKRKPAKRKPGDDAMSPGARAWSKANAGTRTYKAHDTIAERAMSICDREENKTITGPPAWSRFHFYYTENPEMQAEIAGKMAELAKLGVTDITCQSREEYEAAQRADELQRTVNGLPAADEVRHSNWPDAYAATICQARIFARKLWPHDPAETAYLLERIRKAERVVRDHFGDRYKRGQFQRMQRNAI